MTYETASARNLDKGLCDRLSEVCHALLSIEIRSFFSLNHIPIFFSSALRTTYYAQTHVRISLSIREPLNFYNIEPKTNLDVKTKFGQGLRSFERNRKEGKKKAPVETCSRFMLAQCVKAIYVTRIGQSLAAFDRLTSLESLGRPTFRP